MSKTEIENRLWNVFKHSNLVYSIIESFKNDNLLNVRFLIDNVITEFCEKHPFNVQIEGNADVIKHNKNVSILKDMEEIYSEIMELLENDNQIMEKEEA